MFLLTVFGLSSCLLLSQLIYLKKKYMKQERKHLYFIHEVINGNYLFLKTDKTNFFTTEKYIARSNEYEIQITITRRKISCQLLKTEGTSTINIYSFDYNKGEHRITDRASYHESFVKRNPEMISAFTEYITERFKEENTERKHSQTVSQRMRNMLEKRLVTKTEEEKKEQGLSNELKKEVEKIKELHETIQVFQDEFFDMEEQHNINRLVNDDLEKLCKSYLSMENKEREEEKMKESLNLIYQKLEGYKEKISKQKRFEFEKITETIRVRK